MDKEINPIVEKPNKSRILYIRLVLDLPSIHPKPALIAALTGYWSTFNAKNILLQQLQEHNFEVPENVFLYFITLVPNLSRKTFVTQYLLIEQVVSVHM